MENETKQVLTREQAAAYLNIHTNTLDKSNIPRVRIRGRTLFRRPTLDNYLAELETTGRRHHAGSN